MLISLNWIRDFVDVPADLNAQAFAEKFTCTTAELEGFEHIRCEATGLIAAEITAVEKISREPVLYAIKANLGDKAVDSVTIAEGLAPGDIVIYAPPGATLPGIGKVTERDVKGKPSVGMVVPGDALGMAQVGQRAVWMPAVTPPGLPIDMRLFDDVILEIDNKSITHRPDLWGHYGIAREVAAMLGTPLRPYDVTPIDELTKVDLPLIPIEIEDAEACPRYSGLRFTGVRPQPSPLKWQVRLAMVGMRPIDILVDLTNYIMAELGQPMHAFDDATVDRIEVAFAKPRDRFKTLDGEERTMPERALMIKCHGRNVALAGIMGGLETEVTDKTDSLLLESANFEPATIRRCATALGHRTEASARFEKSLDPNHTVLAIQRFVHLARPELPDMALTSRLSDNFPNPPRPVTVQIDLAFMKRFIGKDVPAAKVVSILESLAFGVEQVEGKLNVTVPSFRATKDIGIEADVIEEIARYIGYDSIEPQLPHVKTRYIEPAALCRMERAALTLLCGGMGYAEIHSKIWDDIDWLKTLGYDPGEALTLKNPAAVGSERLRRTLMPNLLAAVDLNRHRLPRFELVDVGSVFPPDRTQEPREDRQIGLVFVAPGRKAAHEDALFARLKTDIETLVRQLFNGSVAFAAADAKYPWDNPAKTATIHVVGDEVGRITVVTAACKRAIDEHLAAWSIATAEINFTVLTQRPVPVRKLVAIPVYPQVDADFSVLADAVTRYTDIESHLARYDHPMLRRLAFVDSFEGGSVPEGKRSYTFRATLGDKSRTLTDEDVQSFRQGFIEHLQAAGLALRS